MDCLKLLQTLEGHDERVWCVAWSPDGKALASSSADRTVRLWAPLRRPAANGDIISSVTNAETPPLAAAAVAASPNGTQPTTVSGAEGSSSAAAALAAAQQQEGRVYGCAAALEDSHTKTVRTVDWSTDGRYLATAGFDGITAIWERQGGVWESVATLEGHENEVKCAAWSPAGGILATCGRDKAVWLWEHLPGNEFECLDVKPAHSADVKAVAWHPGGELLASCSYDDSIKLWAAAGGDEWECAQTLAGPSGHTSTVWSAAFSRDGTLMASCSADNTVRIWECRFEGTQPAFRLSAVISGYHDRTIYSCSWSADGRLATGDASNAIRVFERTTDSSSNNAAAASAINGGTASGGVGDCSSSSWQQVCCVLNAHEADVNSVAWHPSDGTLLASGGDDGVVKLWRLHCGGGGSNVAMMAV